MLDNKQRNNSTTIQDAVENFIREKKAVVRAPTVRRYRIALEGFQRYALTKQCSSMLEVNSKLLDGFRQSLATNNVSEATILTSAQIIKNMLDHFNSST